MLNLFFNTIFSSLRSRQSLVLENITLRQQLVVLRRNNKTPVPAVDLRKMRPAHESDGVHHGTPGSAKDGVSIL